MSELQPTFTCFDDAIEFLVKSQPIQRELVQVVHALCLGDKGELFAHGWVEDMCNALVWQGGIADGVKIFYGLPIDWFYQNFAPQKLKRYRLDEIVKQINCGPWDPEIEAFAGPGKGIHKRLTNVPAKSVVRL